MAVPSGGCAGQRAPAHRPGPSEVVLAKGYKPYGSVLTSIGDENMHYGFTSEWTDSTGLIHLRARYYAPGQGRLVNRDVWEGDSTRPLSLNAWNYVEGNPINYTDPSGMCLVRGLDGKCDPGWRCWLINDPVARAICLSNYCIEPWALVLPLIPEDNLDEDAVVSYTAILNQLGEEWLEPDGRLRDDVLIALIMMEFSIYKGIAGGYNAYLESKEALANQYHVLNANAGHPAPVTIYSGCQSSCDTMAEQVKWMSEIEALRDFHLNRPAWVMNGTWLDNLIEAQQIQTFGFVEGQNLSWVWGNWYEGSPMDKYLQEEGSIDWWDTENDGNPWQAIDKSSKFWVLSKAQDYACQHRSGVKCRGW